MRPPWEVTAAAMMAAGSSSWIFSGGMPANLGPAHCVESDDRGWCEASTAPTGSAASPSPTIDEEPAAQPAEGAAVPRPTHGPDAPPPRGAGGDPDPSPPDSTGGMDGPERADDADDSSSERRRTLHGATEAAGSLADWMGYFGGLLGDAAGRIAAAGVRHAWKAVDALGAWMFGGWWDAFKWTGLVVFGAAMLLGVISVGMALFAVLVGAWRLCSRIGSAVLSYAGGTTSLHEAKSAAVGAGPTLKWCGPGTSREFETACGRRGPRPQRRQPPGL